MAEERSCVSDSEDAPARGASRAYSAGGGQGHSATGRVLRGGRGRPARGKGGRAPSARGGSSAQAQCAKNSVREEASASTSSVSGSESAEASRIRKAEQTWASHKQAKKAKVEDIGDTAMFSPKKQQVEKDCSLMSFVREAVAKLTQEDRRSLNQMAISYAELMAGIGTGTIAMECIVRALATEEVYMQAKPAFFSESCTWKRHRLLQTLSHLKLSAYDMFGSTSDLKALATDLVIVSIECDDISMSSTTQKSVLDTSGRSGQSLTQFFAYLTSLEQTKRPGVIIFECVAALKYNKQFETGTEKVAEHMSEFGYFTSFATLDSSDYGLPQSRKRCYGISLKLDSFGPRGKEQGMHAIQRAWDLIGQLQTTCESLDHLWNRCQEGYQAAGHKAPGRRQEQARKGKWPDLHDRFVNAKKLTQADLARAQLLWAEQQFQGLHLPLREKEAVKLSLASLRKTLDADIPMDRLLVVNSGDSLDRMRWACNIHHCLLPAKSFTYLKKSGASTKQSPIFWFGLQGLAQRELALAGLPGELTLRQVQDLAGNAFSANVIAAMLLGTLCTLFKDHGRQ